MREQRRKHAERCRELTIEVLDMKEGNEIEYAELIQIIDSSVPRNVSRHSLTKFLRPLFQLGELSKETRLIDSREVLFIKKETLDIASGNL